MIYITSSFKEFHIFRAESRAKEAPYTGNDTAILWSVSLLDQMPVIDREWENQSNMDSTFDTGDPAMSFSK